MVYWLREEERLWGACGLRKRPVSGIGGLVIQAGGMHVEVMVSALVDW